MKEITVIAKNDVGSLAVVAEALGNVGVNIEAISAYEKDNQAFFRILTNDATTTMKAIGKIAGMRATESDIILIELSNRPGELGKITRKLANKDVNLESLYIVGKKNDVTEVAIRPAKTDFEKARNAIGMK
ncbi:MAG: hypothetical protein WCT31_02710 [Candidatus Micrarchaeia archaeon]|jgi:hypothetical protein